MFSAEAWEKVPFHFWSVVFFIFGSMVGSFLNVCIHRVPLGESIVSPPSHCPHCKYSIPWFLNIPLVTWLWLRGKCANCRAPISVRYFLVELLTGVMFLGCWLMYGRQSPWIALVYSMVLAGLIVASFIDLEHLIIPDGLNFGGIAVGVVVSALLPVLHGVLTRGASLKASVLGVLVGAGVLYAVLRLGKLAFGKWKIKLEPGTRVIFTETGIVLDGEETPFGDFLYRKSDAIKLKAGVVELADRCYRNVSVRLSIEKLQIGEETFKPEEVPCMEVTTEELVLPREAMGLGDVKLMAAIGAFLGWQATVFSLMMSAPVGLAVSLWLILTKRIDKSRPVPYGPYIAIAAALWIFGGHQVWDGMWEPFRKLGWY